MNAPDSPSPIPPLDEADLGASGGRCRIVRIGGASDGGLVDAARRAADDVATRFAQAERARFSPGDTFRLAIVAEGPDALRRKFGRFVAKADRLDHRSREALARHGVFHGQATGSPPTVAFLFPGQGSQYPGMLRALVETHAAAGRARAEVDAALGAAGAPSFAELAWTGGRRLGVDVHRTQLAVLAADFILLRAVESLGVRAECVAGHSFGEFPALVAAGVWALADAVRATIARCDAVESCPHVRGRMLATGADAELVERLCAEIGDVFPATYNGPRRTVAAGAEPAIAELDRRLRALGLGSRILPVPRPFHTPLMHDVLAPLREALAPIPTQSPRTPVLSTLSGEPLSNPAEIRENVVRQMTTPIRYVDVVRRLAAEGFSVLVEVGPRQILTHLNARILAGGGPITVPSDNPSRPGESQLLALQACIETLGAMG